jgi:hypothetical protein
VTGLLLALTRRANELLRVLQCLVRLLSLARRTDLQAGVILCWLGGGGSGGGVVGRSDSSEIQLVGARLDRRCACG